jgi:hypothetical protein
MRDFWGIDDANGRPAGGKQDSRTRNVTDTTIRARIVIPYPMLMQPLGSRDMQRDHRTLSYRQKQANPRKPGRLERRSDRSDGRRSGWRRRYASEGWSVLRWSGAAIAVTIVGDCWHWLQGYLRNQIEVIWSYLFTKQPVTASKFVVSLSTYGKYGAVAGVFGLCYAPQTLVHTFESYEVAKHELMSAISQSELLSDQVRSLTKMTTIEAAGGRASLVLDGVTYQTTQLVGDNEHTALFREMTKEKAENLAAAEERRKFWQERVDRLSHLAPKSE